MTNITIPLQKEYIDYIDSSIKTGDFDNRSQFIRNAIKKMIEEKEINEILEASRMAKSGGIFEGDIDQLVKE
jgi:Arc/MetJ-type ribon-helix-helix transcriptional regulator